MKFFFVFLFSCQSLEIKDLKKELNKYSLNFTGKMIIKKNHSQVEGLIESEDSIKEWSLSGYLLSKKFQLNLTPEKILFIEGDEEVQNLIKKFNPYLKIFYQEWVSFKKEEKFCPQEQILENEFQCQGLWFMDKNRIFFKKNPIQIVFEKKKIKIEYAEYEVIFLKDS